MRLTTKGRFAVTAMLDLALHDSDGPVTLAGISERQKISLSYLEQLFGKLRRRALVESVRGPGGGNERCMTHDLWEELNSTVYGFLAGVKLSHLVEKQRTKTVSVMRGQTKA